MTTILIILAVIALVLALVIKSLDAQLTLIVRELNETWKVLTELKDNVTNIERIADFETTVKEDAGGYPYVPQIELYDYEKDVPLAKAGDKVKVIIIKGE